jgi:hypothetical protein
MNWSCQRWLACRLRVAAVCAGTVDFAFIDLLREPSSPETQSEIASLPSNYEVVGKRPATRFSSLKLKPARLPRQVCVCLCTSIFLWAGCGGGAARLASFGFNAGLLSFELTLEILTLAHLYCRGGGVHSINPTSCPLSPSPKQGQCPGDPSKQQGDRTLPRSVKNQPLHAHQSAQSSTKSLPCPHSIYATGN